LQTSKTTTKTV